MNIFPPKRTADNHITRLSSKPFEGLSLLNTVSLLRNGCIDEEFKGRDRVLEIFQSVNEKCEIAKKSLLGSKCGTVPMASSRIIRGIETERGQWLKRDLFFYNLGFIFGSFQAIPCRAACREYTKLFLQRKPNLLEACFNCGPLRPRERSNIPARFE